MELHHCPKRMRNLEMGNFCPPVAKTVFSCVITGRKSGKMNSTKSKKHKRKTKNKPLEDWEKELNIRYHDVNPEWNYTISPRSTSKQTSGGKK